MLLIARRHRGVTFMRRSSYTRFRPRVGHGGHWEMVPARRGIVQPDSASDGRLARGIHELWRIRDACCGCQTKPVRLGETGLDGSVFRIQQEIARSGSSLPSVASEYELIMVPDLLQVPAKLGDTPAILGFIEKDLRTAGPEEEVTAWQWLLTLGTRGDGQGTE